jgi:hypothetical protein
VNIGELFGFISFKELLAMHGPYLCEPSWIGLTADEAGASMLCLVLAYRAWRFLWYTNAEFNRTDGIYSSTSGSSYTICPQFIW